MDDSTEHYCDLCKVAYSADSELKDHNWSLMHHIKMEQKNKGSAHSCSLCLAICDNIILYGKHLNEDRHKGAVQRRNQGGKDDILDSFADVDTFGHNSLDTATMDIDTAPQEMRPHNRTSHNHGFLLPDPVGVRRQKVGPVNKRFHGQRHMRSYSEPEIDKVGKYNRNQDFQVPEDNAGGYIPNLMEANPGGYHIDWVPWQHQGQHHRNWSNQRGPGRWDQPPDRFMTPDQWFGNFSSAQELYKPFDFSDQMYMNRHPPPSNFNSNRNDKSDNRHNPRHSVQQNRDEPEYSDTSSMKLPDYVANEFDGDGSHFQGDNSWRSRARGEGNDKRRGSYDSNFNIPDQELPLSRGTERRGRGILRHPRGFPGHQAERDTTNDRLSPDSNSSSDSIPMKRRGDNLDISSGKSRRDNRSNRIQTRPSSVLSNTVQQTESTHSLLNDEANQRQRSRSRSHDRLMESAPGRVEGRRTASPSPSRSSSRQSKQVTWASDTQVSSTTDQVDSDPLTQISHRKKPLPLRSSSADGRKKKIKSKNQRHESPQSLSPRGRPRTKVKDQGETILQKAEILCQNLRIERQKKKEKIEKEQKLAKQRELSKQIEEISEKNKINIRGHLAAVEKVLDSQLMESDNTKTTVAMPSNVLTKAALVVAGSEKNQDQISKIRDDIEKSVTCELRSDVIPSKLRPQPVSFDSTGKKISTTPDSTTSRLNSSTVSNLQSPISQYQRSKLKTDPLQNESLVKMVKSPRSTKERLQLAEMLRTYAKSQTKLSLPRFNLKMSDICSGSNKPDDIADFNLEEMSPEMQIEIAELIEMDIKPDVKQLEQMLNLFSSENAELDSEILSTLGVADTYNGSPSRRPDSPKTLLSKLSSRQSSLSETQGSNAAFSNTSPTLGTMGEIPYVERISSLPLRSSSPALLKREPTAKEDADNRPSLSIDDLVSEVSKAADHLTAIQQNNIHERASITDTFKVERTTSPVRLDRPPFPNRMERDNSQVTMHRSINMEQCETLQGNELLPSVTINMIKQERMDNSYESAAQSGNAGNLMSNISEKKLDDRYSQPGQNSHNYNTREQNYDSICSSPYRGTDNLAATGRESPVRQRLSRQDSDIPERDIYQKGASPQLNRNNDDKWSALDKVNAILDDAPTVEKVLQGETRTDSHVTASPTGREIQPPSYLPPVQTAPILPENNERELDGSQTSSVLEQVYTISLQEESVHQRISTMDARIQQLRSLIDEASLELNKYTEKKGQLQQQEGEMRTRRIKLLEESRSLQGSTSSQNPQNTACLPPDQMADKHPMIMKFLMSQKQPSDLSSVCGYSNVESGSQAEPEGAGGSRRGSLTSVISEPVYTPGQQAQVTKSDDRKFFNQSIDILSGSLSSEKSQPRNVAAAANKNEEIDDSNTQEKTNSLSLLKSPLEKKGFITLDSLLKGEGDMGKLLRKSLEEYGEQGTPYSAGKETPDRTATNTFLGKDTRADQIGEERRSSGLSVSSEDLLSGSDAGKVSLKYMGTLPEGVTYDTLMKQISVDSKNKPVSYTVLSSPEAFSQLKKISDSGIGTSSLSSRVTQDSLGKPIIVPGFVSDDSIKTKTTDTVTVTDFDCQSVRSNYSLGEEIKRRCVGQNVEPVNKDIEASSDSDLTPTGDITNSVKLEACTVLVNKLDTELNTPEKFKLDGTEITNQKSIAAELAEAVASPTRKKWKSKKERDRKSRRKQKESFILESSSDANSLEEEAHGRTTPSNSSSLKSSVHSMDKDGSRKQIFYDEGMVITGSEDLTPRPADKPVVKGSLLAEVQLESASDSSLDPDKANSRTAEELNRMKIQPDVLRSLRSNIRSKLPQGKTPSVQYSGPSLSVAAVQIFKDDLYVCYNGSEIRRFNLKTGEILKELDSSPYLVNCLHITAVPDREDILYTGGASKKLILFKPQRFKLIDTFEYDERIMCLHENWGRLFIGLADGVISVRSLKSDKEVSSFQCTHKSVQCLASTNAGMTKLLCCGTADKIIYILDAMTGLLLTMLQGHKLPPLCIEVFDEMVLSAAADQAMLVHNIRTGDLVQTISAPNTAVCDVCVDDECVYTACHDKLIRCYSKKKFKLQRVCYGAGKGMLTFITKEGNMLITGNREGLVEATPLWSTASSWHCQCDGCPLNFAIRDDLMYHILSDHLTPNSKTARCPWAGCPERVSTEKNSALAEEHILSAHFK